MSAFDRAPDGPPPASAARVEQALEGVLVFDPPWTPDRINAPRRCTG